jgi:hypothetical protein
MNIYVQSLIVFLALFTTDICWAFYISRVKDGNPIHAAKWAVFLYLTGSVGTLGIVHNQWLLIPAGLGAFAGTYLAVWIEHKPKTISENDA